MRRTWMPISILLIAALLASTIVLAALYATKPAAKAGVQITDDLLREVFVTLPVETIVCLHPAATETIFSLEADGKLVAVSDAWLYWIATPEDVVEEIQNRVDTGELTTLNAFAVDPEAILDLEPDVVFVFGYTLPDYAAAIEDEVPVICFAPTTLEDILYDLMVIGKVVDKEAEAENLVNEIKAQFDEIAELTRDVPRPKVFCETGYYMGTIYTTGEGSFVSRLITLAGGDDIGNAVPAGDPVISSEYILDCEPQIIILLDYPFATAESVAGRPGWDAIPAVIDGEIHELDAESVDEISRPGPRIAEGLMVLLGIIHPELPL